MGRWLCRLSCPLLVMMLVLVAYQLIIAVSCDRLQHSSVDASLATYERPPQNDSQRPFVYRGELEAGGLATDSSPTWRSPDVAVNVATRNGNKPASLLARRKRRFAGRGKTGRIMLAQRPPKSSTTTSSTLSSSSSSSTTTKAPEELAKAEKTSAESEAEESADSGDYEELDHSRKQPKATAGGVVSESAEEEAAEEEEQAGSSTTTTTTTTTQRTTTTTRRTSGARKGSAPRTRPTTRAPASSSSTSSLEKMEQEDGGEKARKKLASNEAESGKNDSSSGSANQRHWSLHNRKRPLVALPFIRAKNTSICTPEAYLEFPRDLIGEKWRARGLIIVHVFVVCYMFYALAVVCERYFMPSLEEFAERLQISEDVAGATLMSAGSSAPELFTAILGVFVAKGDVGTGAIVGSAVFNILFVIGICAFVSTTTAQLQWWPVLRDSIYYTFTVLVLILIIYDERITAFESASMIALYGVYIAIMAHNEQLKGLLTRQLLSHPVTAKLISSQSMAMDGPDDVFGGGQPLYESSGSVATSKLGGQERSRVEEDSIWLAGLLLIVRHKRLFSGQLRFQSTARYIITKRQHKQARQRAQSSRQRVRQHEEVSHFGPEGGTDMALKGTGSRSAQRARMEAYARSSTLSKNKFSIVSKEEYEFWQRPPDEGHNYYLWLAKIPVNYVLHYTIPDCTLYPDRYAFTFVISIIWTAFFSYIMVWMVTIIGYTLGIPDSVMGVTFLAAGTSVPDCYSSIHAARNGMADMAVSNSIGSNVFDILIGLAVPWFIQSAIYPGVVASVNSRGVIYSVMLLFLSLVVTIYLMNRCDWNLQPRLGLALIIAYAVFIILTCMLEFNLFGHVNPPPCPAAPGSNY